MRSKPNYVHVFLVSTLLVLVIISMNIRPSTSATITEWDVPGSGSAPYDIVADTSGAVWFAEKGSDQIGRFYFGTFYEYQLPGGSQPVGVDYEPDEDRIWFTESLNNKIGKISSGGACVEYTIRGPGYSSFQSWGIDAYNRTLVWFTEPVNHAVGCLNFWNPSNPSTPLTIPVITEWIIPGDSQPQAIIYDLSTGAWFTDYKQHRIGNIPDPFGSVVKVWYLPDGSFPWDIAKDTKGQIWFTESGRSRIGKLDEATNEITEYITPSSGSEPYGISIDDSNRVWFAEHGQNRIGRYTPGLNVMSEFERSIAGAPWFVTTSIKPENKEPIPPIWFTDAAWNRIGKVDPFTPGGLTTIFSSSLSSASTTSTTTTASTTSLITRSTLTEFRSFLTDMGAPLVSRAETMTTSTSYTVMETITIVQSTTTAVSTILSSTTQTTTLLTTLTGTFTSYGTTVPGTTTSYATSTSYIETTSATLTSTQTVTTTTVSTTYQTTGATAIPGFSTPSILIGLLLGATFLVFSRGILKRKLPLNRQ